MSNCCPPPTNLPSSPRKHTCPANGKEYGQVSPTTIKHHLKTPWLWQEKEQGYYFCADPDCPVVYFGEDGSAIATDALRTEVGVKSPSEDALVCYCFGVTRSEAKRNPLARQFVINETRQKHCACETRNPSGKCCLADFPAP